MNPTAVNARRRQLLLAAALLSIALAIMVSVLLVEFEVAPLTPSAEVMVRAVAATLLACLLFTRTRWAGVPLALFDLAMARWYSLSSREATLNTHGQIVVLVSVVLELACVVLLFVVPPPQRTSAFVTPDR